jgi:hypothetical protein
MLEIVDEQERYLVRWLPAHLCVRCLECEAEKKEKPILKLFQVHGLSRFSVFLPDILRCLRLKSQSTAFSQVCSNLSGLK